MKRGLSVPARKIASIKEALNKMKIQVQFVIDADLSTANREVWYKSVEDIDLSENQIFDLLSV